MRFLILQDEDLFIWFCFFQLVPFLKHIQIPFHVCGYFQCQQLQGPVPAVVNGRLHLILFIDTRLRRLFQELDDQLHRCWICSKTHNKFLDLFIFSTYDEEMESN